MLNHYLPLEAAEQMTRERHPDPRILAAQGSAIPERTTARRRIGRLVVRMGEWVEGQCNDAWSEPEIAHP